MFHELTVADVLVSTQNGSMHKFTSAYIVRSGLVVRNQVVTYTADLYLSQETVHLIHCCSLLPVICCTLMMRACLESRKVGV